MTHILIPREPSTALLRPFIGCNTQELHEAWAAMVHIAEVQHARTGSQRPAQIEQPATLADTTIEQYARMFNAACEALGQVSDCLGINSDIDPGAEPIIAAIEQLRERTDPVTTAPTPQPEALRLAAWLNEGAWHQMRLGDVEAAGRELKRLHADNARLRAAERTLQRLGYQDRGGQEWAPPIGQAPDFDLIDSLRSRLAELEVRKPLPPDALADKCEAWLQAGGAANIVDAFEAGYRAAENVNKGIKQ